MDATNNRIYAFRSFRLDVAERRFTDRDKVVPLTPKTFDVLAYLVERSGHLVEKEELLENIWPDSIVEEANLARIIHSLRRILGEDKEYNKFIETISKKGYRFVAEVEVTVTEPQNGRSFASPTVVDVSDRELTFASEGMAAEYPVQLDSSELSVALALALIGLVAVATGYWISGVWSGGLNDQRVVGPETLSGQALHEYKQGRVLVERRYPGDYPRALEHFERAIELDPNYSNAYAGKADVKVVMFWGSASHQDISEARTAVRKALELDGSNSYARTINCRILTSYDWDHKAAEAECRRAVEIDPTNHEALKELAFLLNSLGNDEEALEAIDRAIAVAPTSFNKRSKGLILYHSRRYDEAIDQFEQVAETDSEFKETTRWLIRTYQMKGEHKIALEYYLKFLEQTGAGLEEIETVRTSFEKSGWPTILKHMAENLRLRGMFLAGTYAQMGETEKAMATLKEMESRKAVMLITVAREPSLDPIRSDPHFAKLLEKIGLVGVAENEVSDR